MGLLRSSSLVEAGEVHDEPIAVKLHDSRNTILVLDWWKPSHVSTTDRHIYNCKTSLPRYGFRVEVVEREALRECQERRRFASAYPHGRCEFADRCVEHAANPGVASCKEVR